MITWKDWLEQARRDLAAAEELGKTGFYEQACFCCQQAVEKALKALLLSKKNDFPKIHSLRKLALVAGVLEELKDLISEIDLDYAATRYLDIGERPAQEIYDKQTFSEHFVNASKAVEVIEKWIGK